MPLRYRFDAFIQFAHPLFHQYCSSAQVAVKWPSRSLRTAGL